MPQRQRNSPRHRPGMTIDSLASPDHATNRCVEPDRDPPSIRDHRPLTDNQAPVTFAGEATRAAKIVDAAQPPSPVSWPAYAASTA